MASPRADCFIGWFEDRHPALAVQALAAPHSMDRVVNPAAWADHELGHVFFSFSLSSMAREKSAMLTPGVLSHLI
jgi:hypothetical protein